MDVLWKAWKPRTASGCRCKHSSCLRCAALRHQREDAAPPSANWDAQTSETVMNMAAFTAGDPQCPECHLQAPKTFPCNLYGIDNVKRRQKWLDLLLISCIKLSQQVTLQSHMQLLQQLKLTFCICHKKNCSYKVHLSIHTRQLYILADSKISFTG